MIELASHLLHTVLGWLAIEPQAAQRVLLGWVVFGSMIMLARQLERIRPIEPNFSDDARAHVASDYKVVVATYFMVLFFAPMAAACSVAVINAFGGGGLIDLSGTSWAGWIGGIVLYVVILDMFIYWLHRLQHMVPALWAMHSFHHSAERITIITGARHYWLLSLLTVAFFPFMDIFFRITPEMALIVRLIFVVPDSFAHLNYRLPFGRWVYLIGGPHWHRIHHSNRPEHVDKNFSSLLPVMDFIFGTAVVPNAEEYPTTGLTPAERPSIIHGIFWPWRRHTDLLIARTRQVLFDKKSQTAAMYARSARIAPLLTDANGAEIGK